MKIILLILLTIVLTGLCINQVGNETNQNILKECSSCPQPTSWSNCVNNQQNRTNYKCDASTNYSCESFTEIQNCQSENVSLTTNKETYKKGENVTIILEAPADTFIYVLEGKAMGYKDNVYWEGYRLENNEWKAFRYGPTIFGCFETCINNNLQYLCADGPSFKLKMIGKITWVWNQKIWKSVSKTCGNKTYIDEEEAQVDVGDFKIRIGYYYSNSTERQNVIETSFSIIE